MTTLARSWKWTTCFHITLYISLGVPPAPCSCFCSSSACAVSALYQSPLWHPSPAAKQSTRKTPKTTETKKQKQKANGDDDDAPKTNSLHCFLFSPSAFSFRIYSCSWFVYRVLCPIVVVVICFSARSLSLLPDSFWRNFKMRLLIFGTFCTASIFVLLLF